jgi:hypothetical protein
VVLDDPKIRSWSNDGDDFDVALARDTQRHLRGLARENENAMLEIYRSRRLLAREKIATAVSEEHLRFTVAAEARDEIAAMLPAMRRR